MSRARIISGAISAVIHTLVVLAVFWWSLTIDDGTERWALMVALVHTIDIWSLPILRLISWDLADGWYWTILLLGGGLVYFAVGRALHSLASAIRRLVKRFGHHQLRESP